MDVHHNYNIELILTRGTIIIKCYVAMSFTAGEGDRRKRVNSKFQIAWSLLIRIMFEFILCSEGCNG
jgi:hypothetical protein